MSTSPKRVDTSPDDALPDDELLVLMQSAMQNRAWPLDKRLRTVLDIAESAVRRRVLNEVLSRLGGQASRKAARTLVQRMRQDADLSAPAVLWNAPG